MPTELSWPLLGRSGELDELRSALEQRVVGDRCVLLIGEPGIGKSALLAAFGDLSQESGARVLSVRGLEAEQDLPFAGLHQLLAPLCSHLGSLPAVQRAAAETAIGLTAGDPPKVFLVGLAALGLITQSAAVQDVVITIDNLAWIDQLSQVVLAFLVRRLSDQSVVVVAAVRSGYDGALAEVSRVLELGPLTGSDSERLLLRAHSGISSGTKNHVLSQARGNPLALVELPNALPRAFRVQTAHLASTIPLPRKLRQAFGNRLPSLPPASRDAVLVAAAYAGTEVALVLSAASTLHGAQVTTADLEPAVAAGVLRVAGPMLEFCHPLIRSSVMTEATASRRLATHAALGEVLAVDTPPGAWHRASAVLSQNDDIADELEAMAPLASAHGSLASSVQFLERSAELTSDPRRRGHRYLEAAIQSLSMGDAASSDELLSQAREFPLGRLDQLAAEWAHEVVHEGEALNSDRVRRLCQLADEAAALADNHLALDLLLAAAMRCWWSDFAEGTCRTLTNALVSFCRHRDDPRFLAALAVAGPVLEGMSADAMLTQFDLVRVSDAQALRVLGITAHVLGDSPRAGDYLGRAETELRRRGAVGQLVQVLLTQVPDLLATGEWSRADAAIQEARRFGDETDQRTWNVALLVCRAHSAALRGHLPKALELAGRAELAASRGQITVLLEGAQLARGCAWAGVGRFSEAYAELRGILAQDKPGAHAGQLFPALMFLAEAGAHTGQQSDAAAVIAPWMRRAATSASPNAMVHLAYAQAALASDDAAEKLYEAALGCDLHRWPFVRAMLQSAYGAWLRRQRRIVESRRLIRSALLTFDLIGARGWAARARSELAATGERHDMPGAPTDLALSPQQLEIARLAASGLSNREIGEQLFLSPRTIGSHLYRIFPKLGVTSRVQLVQRLDRRTPEQGRHSAE